MAVANRIRCSSSGRGLIVGLVAGRNGITSSVSRSGRGLRFVLCALANRETFRAIGKPVKWLGEWRITRSSW